MELINYMAMMLARRSPMLLMCLGGIILAIIWWKRHPRASSMTVLALTTYFVEAILFSIFLYWFPRLIDAMKMRSASMSTVYAVVFFFEDFVYAGVILLLVAAAFTGRSEQLETQPQPPIV